MPELSFQESKIVYAGKDCQKTLLDHNDLFANKSRISMQRLPGQDFLTVPSLLLGLVQWEQKEGSGLEFPFGLIGTLLAAQLIQFPRPVRVLEYGCEDGRLSFHLAKILGAFHEESSLVCAYDTMDELWMQWMERIASIEKPPKMSYLAGDYGNLQLQKDYFDLIVINGRTNLLAPQKVIEDALSLVTKEGSLLCYIDNSPLLESTFKLYFETRDEYEMLPSNRVLFARAKDRNWYGQPGTDIDSLGRRDLEAARKLLNQRKTNHKALSDLIKRLQDDILIAAQQGQIDWKLRLMNEKESLIKLAVSKQ